MSKAKKFTVIITRTETYTHEIEVEAESKDEAEELASQMDENNAFENVWNEGPFDVSTDYHVKVPPKIFPCV